MHHNPKELMYHFLFPLAFLCVTPCIWSRDAGRLKLSFLTQEPILPGQSFSLALKLPDATEINRVITICSNSRQCQVLLFLGSLQLWLKTINKVPYPMGSELALLLEPVAVVAAGTQTGWKEITQGHPQPHPLTLSHKHRLEKGDKDTVVNLLIGLF